MKQRWERYFWILLGTGIMAWCLAMGLHAGNAKTIVPRGPGGPPVVYEGDVYEIKIMVYDAGRGMVFTWGSQEQGPVVFKTAADCIAAIKGDEAFKKTLAGIRATATEKLGQQTRVLPVCVPVQLGEKID